LDRLSRLDHGSDHVHPRQEERFEVLSGRLGLRADGIERVHGVGDVIVVSAGSPHAAWNAGDDEVHALVDFEPALRTETAFEILAGLACDGKTNRAGVPRNQLQLTLILREFEDEIYFVRPPLGVQRVILGALAFIGRLLGYRAEYPYPYTTQSEAYRIVM
jgi:hypothetical protein